MDFGAPDLLFERRGSIAWVTFNRPQARNAMTFAMYDGLVGICDAVDKDPDIRVLVLIGAGDKAFVSGTDISQFQTFTDPEHAIEYERRVDAVIGRLESLQRPSIAAISGYAVGGGASIAMACDLRIGTLDTRIGVPIARTLGNCLSMANYARLVDLIGPARTKEIIFTGRMIEAAEARSVGLLNEIVDLAELATRAEALASQIAMNAPITIQVTKEAVRRVLVHRRPPKVDDLVLRAYQSNDFKEGVRAFLDKRNPMWTGT